MKEHHGARCPLSTDVPVLDRRRRPGRPRGRAHPGPPRHRVAAGRAARRRRRPTPGRRSSAPAPWSSCAPGASRTRCVAGGVDVELAAAGGARRWPRPPTAARLRRAAHTRAQAARSARRAPACVPRTTSSRCSSAHLRALRHRARRARHRAASPSADDGDRARPCATAAGEPRAVAARYVVAADGARSAIRRAARHRDARLDGAGAGRGTLPRAAVGRLLGAAPYGIYVDHRPGGGGAVLPWRAGRPLGLRHRDAGRRRASRTRDAVARARSAAAAPARRASPPARSSRIASARFSSRRCVAERFREGPAFLVGDAAHRVTPRGGTGHEHGPPRRRTTSAGGWPGSCRAGPAPALLDGYEAERRPVAEHNVRRSTDPDGSATGSVDGARRRPRRTHRPRLARRRRPASPRST